MKPQYKALILISVALISYAFGRYVQPAKVVTEIKQVEVEKVKTEYRTIVKTVTRPDGSTEKEEIKEVIKDTENSSLKDMKKIVDNTKPQWKAGLLIGGNSLQDFSSVYGVQLERRILGPIFLGVWGTTAATSNSSNKTLGLTVGLEF